MKLALVRSELLENANPGTGPQYRDHVVWLHLLVDESGHRLARRRKAFKRQSKVVNHERDRTSHLFASQAGRLYRLCGLRNHGLSSRFGRWFSGRDIRKVRNSSFLSVLGNLEVFRLKIYYLLSVFVRYDDVDLHKIGVNSNYILLCGLLCGLLGSYWGEQ